MGGGRVERGWEGGGRVEGGARGGALLFRHAYTIVRPDSGPQCNRLRCARGDAYSTGCVATHLQASAERCEAINRTWRGDAGAARPSQAAIAIFAQLRTIKRKEG